MRKQEERTSASSSRFVLHRGWGEDGWLRPQSMGDEALDCADLQRRVEMPLADDSPGAVDGDHVDEMRTFELLRREVHPVAAEVDVEFGQGLLEARAGQLVATAL